MKIQVPLSCNILSYPMWTWVCLYVSWWIHPGLDVNLISKLFFFLNYCPCLTCLIVSRSLNSYKVPNPVEALNPALNSLKVELSPILSTVKTEPSESTESGTEPSESTESCTEPRESCTQCGGELADLQKC